MHVPLHSNEKIDDSRKFSFLKLDRTIVFNDDVSQIKQK